MNIVILELQGLCKYVMLKLQRIVRTYNSEITKNYMDIDTM